MTMRQRQGAIVTTARFPGKKGPVSRKEKRLMHILRVLHSQKRYSLLYTLGAGSAIRHWVFETRAVRVRLFQRLCADHAAAGWRRRRGLAVPTRAAAARRALS